MKILFPPGIGDIYWSLVKLRSFLRAKGAPNKPDIYIGTRPDEFDSHQRAWPFLSMFPFVNPTGQTLNVDDKPPRFWERAYTQSRTGIFRNVLGCDYFIVYNGPINAGIPLNEVDPQFECEWDLLLPASDHQVDFQNQCQVQFGRYIVYHFGTRGTYKYWTEEFSVDQIIEGIKLISQRTQTTPVLAGGIWDKEDAGLVRLVNEAGCRDMMGQTSLDELYGMIRGAAAVTGFPSGLSILAPVLGTKTLSLWSGLYPQGTWWNVVPPSTWMRSYWAVPTKGYSVSSWAGQMEGIINA